MKVAVIHFQLLAALFIFVLSACNVNRISELEILRPQVSVDYFYYEISGNTASKLRAQMTQYGPSDERGIQHNGYTNWYVDCYYPNSIIDGRCATGPIAVTVTITHTFPKWDIPPGASKALVTKWNAYIDALNTHEAGHRQIAIDAGFEIAQALSKLPVYTSCDQLEQIADAIGQKILEEARQKEITYDQTTKHGMLQGARFP